MSAKRLIRGTSVAFVALAVVVIGVSVVSTPGHVSAALAQASSQGCPNDDSGLKLPPGFCATVFADGVGHARHMVVAKLRTVPVTLASAGSTLWLPPPLMRVTDNTADSAGSMRRATMVLSCPTSWLAASSTSGVRCGCAAWPPRPRSTMSKRSAAAMIGPGRVCAWPTGRSGRLCSQRPHRRGNVRTGHRRPWLARRRRPPRPAEK